MSQIPREMTFESNAEWMDVMCDLMCGSVEEDDEGDEYMYECFHCGSMSVIWDADFSFEDYGYEGEGIVHNCHCTHCGAQIQYMIRLDDGDDE